MKRRQPSYLKDFFFFSVNTKWHYFAHLPTFMLGAIYIAIIIHKGQNLCHPKTYSTKVPEALGIIPNGELSVFLSDGRD